MIEVLDHMAKLAKSMDTARFSKEAMFSSRKMSGRLLSKQEDLGSVASEAATPSFLRRKTEQGTAQFRKCPDDEAK